MGCGSSASAPKDEGSKPVQLGLIVPESMKVEAEVDFNGLSESEIKNQVDSK